MQIVKLDLKKAFDYEEITTFDSDFAIADCFGEDAIKSTFKNCFRYAKLNHKYLTELVIVLNHRLWYHYRAGGQVHYAIAKLYDSLWREADSYACEHLKGEEASYFYRVTD